MSEKSTQESPRNQSAVFAVVSGIVDICHRGESVDDTYSLLLQKLKELIDFDAATVFVAGGDEARLRQAASVGGVVELLDFLSMDHGDGLSGWTADTGKPVVISDRTAHQDFDPAVDYASFMSVPLLVKKNVVAVINFGSKTPGAYTGKQADLASQVAGQMSLVFETIELRRQRDNLEGRLKELSSRLDKAKAESQAWVEPDALREFIGKINHDINNSLAILVGNVQCMQMEKKDIDQKSLSRLKRMERALLKINEANHKILQLIPSRNQKTGPSDDSGSREETVSTNA